MNTLQNPIYKVSKLGNKIITARTVSETLSVKMIKGKKEHKIPFADV